jgi:voltage-gated potassium channel
MKTVLRDAWGGTILLAATTAALLIPARLVLGSDVVPAFGLLEGAITLLFVVDAGLRIRDEFKWRGTEHPSMLVADAVAAIPWHALLGIPALGVVRLAKLARVARLLHAWRLQNLAHWNLLRLVYVVYWMLLSVHWLATGWLALRGRPPGMDEGTAYLQAWYWCMQTLSTIGYGDITPRTAPEMIYAIAVMIVGVGMYGYVIGNVANLIANLQPSRVRFLETMERLTAFMRYRRLPPRLQQKVRDYYTHVWEQRLGYDESTFIAGLPTGLMTEVTMFLRHDIIQKVPFLHDAGEDLLRELALAVRPVVVTPGEVVFREGETGREMYLISRGTVEVLTKASGGVIATLTEGEFFGEMALLLNQPRGATVRAVGYCDLYTLDKATFDRIIAHHPTFAAHINSLMRGRQGKSHTGRPESHG